MDKWAELYELIRANALAGPDKISFEFFLLDKVDPYLKVEDVKDMIDTSAEFFAVANNMKLDEARKIFHANIRYIAGYYDKKTATKWREILDSYN